MRDNSRKAYIIIFSTFLLGAITGLAAGSFIWKQSAQPAAGYQGMVEELSSELHLSADQRLQVEKILNESKQQFQDIRKQVHPKFVEIRVQYREKISSILSPEQREAFETWKQKQDARRDTRRPDGKPDNPAAK
ncbi:MAG: hypothetical protein KF868_12280 [Acidobacteria bacterium]|nr:hypothetical protein [Acidobacteriota bacterium]MCW5967091.1 hypothetical protein [Blastocatellales bacterium]